MVMGDFPSALLLRCARSALNAMGALSSVPCWLIKVRRVVWNTQEVPIMYQI